MRNLKRIILFLIFAILFVPLVFAKDLDVTIVYDNNPYNEQLETRWGFSCLVEGFDKTILFDVGGEGSILLRNMDKLKIDPKAINMIILSHIHYDHIGGLSSFLQKNSEVAVYLPESLPQSVKRTVKEAGAKLVEVRKPLAICKHVYSTGEPFASSLWNRRIPPHSSRPWPFAQFQRSAHSHKGPQNLP